jgi:hypothetical protein
MGRWTKEYHLYNIDTETEIILSQDHHGKWAWDLEEQINGERIDGSPGHVFDTAKDAAKAARKYYQHDFLREYGPLDLNEAAY